MLRTESYKKGLVYSTGLNIVAKGIYFVNTLTIAFFFGTSIGTDIYFFVLGIGVLITSGMFNAIDATILIPQAMKLREQKGEDASRRFLNFFLLLYTGIGALIVLIILYSPVSFFNIFSKFDPSVLEQQKNLLLAGSGLIFFQLINNLLAAILSSYKYFTVPILTSLVTSLFSIIVTVFFHKQLGIAGTIAAVAISYGINFLFLIAIMILRLKWDFSKTSFVKDKTIWVNIGLMQLNILPTWLRNYIVLFLLTGLGAGVISAVNLAQQAAGIFDVLLIGQVLSVAGVKFNELYAKADLAALNDLFIKIGNILLLLLMPIVLIIFFYADDISTVIFKRGNMGNNSIDTVALCLKYLILTAPLLLLNTMCTRIFSATHILRKSLLYSFAAQVVFLLLSVVLINWLQLPGYLYSMIAGYCIIIFLFYYLFKTKLHQIDFDAILWFGLKQLFINLVVALPVFFVLKKWNGKNDIILLLIAAATQVIVVGLINKKQLYLLELRSLFSGNK